MNNLFSIIPQPVSLRPLEGTLALSLGNKLALVAPKEFHAVAELMAAQLRSVTRWEVPVLTAEPADRTLVVFNRDAGSLAPEAYRLRVTPARIEIDAADATGAFYATQTLMQLFPPIALGSSPMIVCNWRLPCVEIEDAPRFRWRGVMIDSARNFQPLSWLKRFVDLMGQHKLNVLHWHLTEDQGWRIEIKAYPKFHTIGSRRPRSMRGFFSGPIDYNDTPVEGFYSQEEIKEFIAYAALRGVQILPEIEMPGHATAAIAAYPELGVFPNSPPEVCCDWGIIPNLFNTKETTLQVLRNVLTEVAELFPFGYIHTGGDEALKTQWQADPATQAHMRELGLADEHALQNWFTGRMAEHLQSLGRRMVGWEEIIEGGALPPGTAVMSWKGVSAGIEAANHGHDVIMCPYQQVYLNFYQSEDLDAEPLSFREQTIEPQNLQSTLENVHAFEPVPAGLNPGCEQHVLGVQGQLWTEYIATTSRLEFMAFPRMCALAEVAWSPQQRPDFSDFSRRLKTHLRRLDCQDIRYRAP